MRKQDIMDQVGDFTWGFGHEFFIETAVGNFVWSDPDYNGDNTIKKFNGTYKDWINGGFGRCKGTHIISDYCGTEWGFVNETI